MEALYASGSERRADYLCCLLINQTDAYLTANMERLRLNPRAKEFVPPGKGYPRSWQSLPVHNKVI